MNPQLIFITPCFTFSVSDKVATILAKLSPCNQLTSQFTPYQGYPYLEISLVQATPQAPNRNKHALSLPGRQGEKKKKTN